MSNNTVEDIVFNKRLLKLNFVGASEAKTSYCRDQNHPSTTKVSELFKESWERQPKGNS